MNNLDRKLKLQFYILTLQDIYVHNLIHQEHDKHYQEVNKNF